MCSGGNEGRRQNPTFGVLVQSLESNAQNPVLRIQCSEPGRQLPRHQQAPQC